MKKILISTFNEPSNSNKILNIGLDAGSTTLKVVVTDENHFIIYKSYRRHYANIVRTLHEILAELIEKIDDQPARLCITGSAGMGIAERSGVQFVQEVVASAHFIERFIPDVKTFIEIGGEYSKIIFFDYLIFFHIYLLILTYFNFL